MLPIQKISKKIDKSLHIIINSTIDTYKIETSAPQFYSSIKEFTFRNGKRIRPLLFVLSYMGFSDRIPKNLFTCAASLELFHTFILIHDDIIDKTSLRRGGATLHQKFNSILTNFENPKFKGEDLSIVVGDLIYSMAIHSFLSIKEKRLKKEHSLRKILETAFHTGNGQLLELINTTKKMSEISLSQIYHTYDLKTAAYTFAGPLAAGAILGGASGPTVKKLFDSGIKLGRAFQIKDDLLDIFGETDSIGKNCFNDISEAKKTLPIWHAYQNGTPSEREFFDNLYTTGKLKKADIARIRRVLQTRGSVEYSSKIMRQLISIADIETCAKGMKKDCRKSLMQVINNLLNVKELVDICDKTYQDYQAGAIKNPHFHPSPGL
jgi:geranylgeranyl diphosphate synthase type I